MKRASIPAVALARRPARPGARPRRLRREERGHDRQDGSAQPHPRLLPKPRPRRDLHGAEARLLRRSRARRRNPDPLRPRRAAQAARRRAHRPGDLLRARGDPGPRTGPRRQGGRRPGQPPADLDDLAEEIGDQGRRGPARQDDRHGRHPLPGRLPEDDPRPGQAEHLRRQGGQRRLRPAAGAARRQGPGDARRLQQRRGRRPAAARLRPGRHPGRQARRADLRRAGAGRPGQAAAGRPAGDQALHRRVGPRHRRRGQEPAGGGQGAAGSEPGPRPEADQSRAGGDAAAAQPGPEQQAALRLHGRRTSGANSAAGCATTN